MNEQERAVEKLDLWIDNHLWVWLIWDFPGFRWIWERIWPESARKNKPAPTITLWLLSVYTALFGIASTRYENQADRIEMRANAIISQLGNNDARPNALAQIARVQRIKLSVKPVFFAPAKTLGSFHGKEDVYEPGIDHLRDAVAAWKDRLEKGMLSGAILRNADLSYAKLNYINLDEGNLSGADLSESKLYRAYMIDVDLSGAILDGTDLSGANLSGANLSRANLFRANLRDTDLSGANLSGAKLNWLKNWERASWDYTNIYGVKNAPEGFREYVLAHGGIEKAPEEE